MEGHFYYTALEDCHGICLVAAKNNDKPQDRQYSRKI
jgi:hypothetical protein